MTNDCNCNKCCSKPKCGNPCGCPMKVLSVETIPENPGYVKFNLDGGTVIFDFSEVVEQTETDTFLRIDAAQRALKYLAEGHTNNISASQLGGILHVADIGDVDTEGVKDNALFVYQKNTECGTGCGSVQNKWIPWSASDNLDDTLEYGMGFNDDGEAKALDTPTHADQYYSVMWRAGDKLGYKQPAEVTSPSVDSEGKSRLLFENPTTHEIEAFPVYVSIVDGLVTIRTTEAS